MTRLPAKSVALGLVGLCACGGPAEDEPVESSTATASTPVSAVPIMPAARLRAFRTVFPTIEDPVLREILESKDTMYYDKFSIIPGYQDSFGDNVQTPIGFRPNSIRKVHIDLAVPGGHGLIFDRIGEFHFPMGRTGGPEIAKNTFVLDFWKPPREDGEMLPVVWWRRRPSGLTNRIEWAFPKGTVLGEIQYIIDADGRWFPFEIRTRTRTLRKWTVDVYRPFLSAIQLAEALEAKRNERAEWSESTSVDRLIAHLRNNHTLEPASQTSRSFGGVFDDLHGVLDFLPETDQPALIGALMRETPFESALGAVWKDDGERRTFAPSTRAAFSIVPQNYTAGLEPANDETCEKCHRDAGRPFKDWFPNIIAYGETWGEDDTFTWHPFETANFVDSTGEVRNFNYDNRKMRSDWVEAGLVQRYNGNEHSRRHYTRIGREWKNYSY